jgi:hypothetical protein
MLRGQGYDFHSLAGKEAAGADEQDLGPLFYEARKGIIDVSRGIVAAKGEAGLTECGRTGHAVADRCAGERHRAGGAA